LSIDTKKSTGKTTITYKSPMVGYEIPAFTVSHGFLPIKNKSGTSLLTLRNSNNQHGEMAALTSWGGYVLDPFIMTQLPNQQARWVINPLRFFPQALHLKLNLAPDVTTENGRRLMMVHVDGDGFVSRAEWQTKWLSGEAMLKEIFLRYKIPMTVSVIQGEIAADGLYPKLYKAAEDVARKIFHLSWIEIASHSYSHPYIWPFEVEKVLKKINHKQDAWHLPLPGYKFDLQKEITGSVNYIDKDLAPKGKRCKVFLWTGRCNPNSTAVALTYKDHLYNMNGGDTIITNIKNSLTNIAPLGVYRGKYFQVFAPNQNENIYTNLWRGPFYGYQRAIETFKLTNTPRRFKPIDIYFHFYSASKVASLKALKTVFDWALKQPVFNVYASEYIRKVLDFNRMVIAKKGNGWLVNNDGNLRELRVPRSLGYPDLKHSENVIGFKPHGKEYYLHLGSKLRSFILFSKQEPMTPYIRYTNGFVSKFERKGDRINFVVRSHMPLQLAIANMQQYKLYEGTRLLKSRQRHNGLKIFTLAGNVNHAVAVY